MSITPVTSISQTWQQITTWVHPTIIVLIYLVENCKLDPLSTTNPIALAVYTAANYFEPISFRNTINSRYWTLSRHARTGTCSNETRKIINHIPRWDIHSAQRTIQRKPRSSCLRCSGFQACVCGSKNTKERPHARNSSHWTLPYSQTRQREGKSMNKGT